MDLSAVANELFEYRDGALYRKPTRAGSFHKSDGYRNVRIGGKRFQEHRVIYAMFYGETPLEVDHINGDRSDNRIENLRPATVSQNRHNQKLKTTNKSGVKGVSWHKETGKWQVHVKHLGKSHYFGVFDDLEAAREAAEAGRIKLHKEYANHGI